MQALKSIELCAGAGGQAIGLEAAGFDHIALVELDPSACDTLRHNRPGWRVVETDVRNFDATSFSNVDLVSAGVPCPPFSIAGKKLGNQDDRDLFPEAIRVIRECRPKAILLENVKGILTKRFDLYRKSLVEELKQLGYLGEWKLIYSCDFEVPQLRPRAIFIGFKENFNEYFKWPTRNNEPPTVGETLKQLMAELGWEGVDEWSKNANSIAPTLVGGSKKHGGADLGPTRARTAWAKLGVNGKSLAEHPPKPGFTGNPRLTVKMAAKIQGFPDEWEIIGKKTAAYRQVGNAFPPPVAKALGEAIRSALNMEYKIWKKGRVQEISFENTL